MSQQHTHGNHSIAFEDLGRSFPMPEPRPHRSASATPRLGQVNATRTVTSDASRVTPNALGSPLHRNMTGTPRPLQLNATRVTIPDMPRASPDVPGSDVSRPAPRAFYEVGDDQRSTPAPDDETESQISYEYGVREVPENPGYTPTSSSSDIVHQESEQFEEDHVRRLKLWVEKVAAKFDLKAPQFSELTMFIELGKNLDTGDLRMRIWQLATNHKLLNGLEEIKSYTVNTKNAVESATAGIRSGFQLSIDQTMQVLPTKHYSHKL